MAIRVVCYKKLEMTDDEFGEFQKICKNYDKPNLKGEDLFRDLFETDDNGLIVYIKSLNNKQFSFEIMFFLMNLMQNQWLRVAMTNVDVFLKRKEEEYNLKIQELELRIKELDNKISTT